MFPLTGEARELPDQNHLERGGGLAPLVDHVAELGPIGDSAALGLVHVLAGDGVAVGLGVVPERPKLGGHGEVHVLAVAGDPGVEGRPGQGLHLFSHLSSLFCLADPYPVLLGIMKTSQRYLSRSNCQRETCETRAKRVRVPRNVRATTESVTPENWQIGENTRDRGRDPPLHQHRNSTC